MLFTLLSLVLIVVNIKLQVGDYVPVKYWILLLYLTGTWSPSPFSQNPISGPKLKLCPSVLYLIVKPSFCFSFRNCTSIKRHYKLWYTLSVAQRLTISFCGLQRLRPIAMSAKVSYGELRDRACDALNAASSVMKNAKTSSTQIAYNVSHNNTCMQ